MSTLVEQPWKGPPSEKEPDQPRVNVRDGRPVLRETSIEEEQIRALVQRLFFRHDLPQVRHIGFAAADRETDTGELCFSIARVLAEDFMRKVAVIDAGPGCAALPALRENPTSDPEMSGREFAPRCWVVPLESWMDDAESSVISDQNLDRLRRITFEFDFALLRCSPAIWAASRVGKVCDGLVLVLTANKTRRLVAAQMSDQLHGAGIPVLGAVLAGRRFPIPEGLYRKL